MRDAIEEVLKLQAAYTYAKSPAMDRRRLLISGHIANAVEDVLKSSPDLAHFSWSVEGSNGKGYNSAVPWVRIYDPTRSPRATDGWYLVYLFNATGESAYLTLMQGTSMWSAARGKFVARPRDLIEKKVEWARNSISNVPEGVITTIKLDSKQPQPQGYERGLVYAIEYPIGQVPHEVTLEADIIKMSDLLRQIYVAAGQTYVPGDTPEVHDATKAAEQSAGKLRSSNSKGQGFIQSVPDKIAIERHAVARTIDYFSDLGYQVSDVGATKSFDLEATCGHESLHVEVKGTTATGGEVILTFNEVEHHLKIHPANALVVVHSIKLDRSSSPPVASGGELVVKSPWVIDAQDLKPIAYRYTTGIE